MEAEAGREAHCAEHAEMVLVETLFGATDGADYAGVEIGEAAHVVNYGIADGVWIAQALNQSPVPTQWVQQQSVNGEVAAADVLFGAGGVADSIRMASVGVGAVGAEGCHFGSNSIAFRFGSCSTAFGYQDNAEFCAYGKGTWEEV